MAARQTDIAGGTSSKSASLGIAALLFSMTGTLAASNYPPPPGPYQSELTDLPLTAPRGEPQAPATDATPPGGRSKMLPLPPTPTDVTTGAYDAANLFGAAPTAPAEPAPPTAAPTSADQSPSAHREPGTAARAPAYGVYYGGMPPAFQGGHPGYGGYGQYVPAYPAHSQYPAGAVPYPDTMSPYGQSGHTTGHAPPGYAVGGYPTAPTQDNYAPAPPAAANYAIGEVASPGYPSGPLPSPAPQSPTTTGGDATELQSMFQPRPAEPPRPTVGAQPELAPDQLLFRPADLSPPK